MKHKIKYTCACKKVPFFWCLNEVHDFVEIKESNLPDAGVGLFAKKDIPGNIALTWYKGNIINHEAFNKSYAWNFISDLDDTPKKLEALLDYVGNPLAYVNTFANDDQKKLLNTKKIVNNERVYYVTIKKIKAGEEIIVDYESDAYRRKLNNRLKYNERIKANRIKK
tara:strand:- start:69 stop:569 length:501 start_codon:yes stop_codon:yes gene_type:complete